MGVENVFCQFSPGPGIVRYSLYSGRTVCIERKDENMTASILKQSCVTSALINFLSSLDVPLSLGQFG